MRRLSDWSCINTLLTYLVRVLTTAMITYDDIGGACFRYFAALLKCSNSCGCFWRSQSHTMPITTHCVVSFGHVLCPISVIKLFYAWRCITTAFIVWTNSPSRISSYAPFITRSSWCNPHQTRYTWCFACSSNCVTMPWIQPVITGVPFEPIPRILDLQVG